MNKITLSLICCLALPSFAKDNTANLQVSSTLNPTCTLKANSVAFGDLSMTSMNSRLETYEVQCSRGSAYNLKLQNSTMREMSADDEKLRYSINFDESNTDLSVTSGPEGQVASGTGSGEKEQVFVLFRVPRGQYTKPANYSDTTTLSVDY